MSKTIAVNDDVYEMVKEFAKEDCRTVRQEASYMLKFAYKNMNNPVLKVADAMAPQKGMTPEEVKQTPKYKELEGQIAELERESYEIEERFSDIKTNEEMLEFRNMMSENKNKQDNIRNQMRAMLNV